MRAGRADRGFGTPNRLTRDLGWERRSQVPSEATFSRAFAEFARGELPDKVHAALIERALGGRIIGAIARDATEIEAREKPVQNKPNGGKDYPPPPENPPPPRKRGRPRKDDERPKPEPTRIERQVTQTLGQMLVDLPTACDVGCKKNSKGYKETWTGYKLHIDVASGLIPVSCVLTSASVHDSQVAIWVKILKSAPSQSRAFDTHFAKVVAKSAASPESLRYCYWRTPRLRRRPLDASTPFQARGRARPRPHCVCVEVNSHVVDAIADRAAAHG